MYKLVFAKQKKNPISIYIYMCQCLCYIVDDQSSHDFENVERALPVVVFEAGQVLEQRADLFQFEWLCLYLQKSLKQKRERNEHVLLKRLAYLQSRFVLEEVFPVDIVDLDAQLGLFPIRNK